MPSIPAKYPTKLRRHQPRSRRGCLTCRQRKKKCDETKPTCLGCRRNNLACAWPAPDDASTSTSETGPDTDADAASRTDAVTDTTVATEWSPDRCAFVTVAPAPATAPSAVALTPLSASLLRYYLVATGPMLATTVHAAHNPFLAVVLPLAHTDDLVMHCVLALGGAHLSSSCVRRDHERVVSSAEPSCSAVSVMTSSSSSSSSASALQAATARHYACVLRSLRRAALGALRPDDAPQVLRLLLVLLLLARYEGLSWNALGGGVRAHLRASRQLLLLLREDTTSITTLIGGGARPRGLTPDERSLLGALLEAYAYLVTVNRVCPDEEDGRCGGGGDDDEDGDLDTDSAHDDEDFVADPGRLADQPCFGWLMAGLHDLFALVGPVTRLAGRIQRDGATTATTTAGGTTAARIDALRARVCAWRLPPPPPGSATPFAGTPAGSQDRVWQRAIGEVYRHALLMYLVCLRLEVEEETSMEEVFTGHDDDDPDDHTGPGDPAYNRTPVAPPAIRPHLSAFGQAILCTCLPVSRFGPLLLWPLLVAGSTFVSPSSRRALSRGLRGTPVWEPANNPDAGPHPPPTGAKTSSAWPQFAATVAANTMPSNLTNWGMVRAADVLEALWQRHDAVVAQTAAALPLSSSTSLPPPGSGPLGWHTYYGPHGMARLLQETNVRPCLW